MFKPNVSVTIRHPVDGGPGGASHREFTVPALLIECDERDFGKLPGAHLRRELLIPPPELPEVGDLAVCGDEVWEFKKVRICRDLDGAVAAARCLVEA